MPSNISIIIPTKNEEVQLPLLPNFLNTVLGKAQIAEIIAGDGKSTADTVCIANLSGVKVEVSEQAGRGLLINVGAKSATGNILYFFNAHSIPPTGFVEDILEKLHSGYDAGCYRLQKIKDTIILM